MRDRITIATFTFPNEYSVIMARLESEGIRCFVKDEMTVQVNPFYSNAIGGIKLQVERPDAERAIRILKETGYLSKRAREPTRIWSTLHNLTVKIPLLNRIRFELRVLVLTAILLGIIGTLLYMATVP